MSDRGKSTVLVIDVGNTSTSLGLYRDGRVDRVDRLAGAAATPASVHRTLGHVCGGQRVTGVVLSSVVPSVNRMWTAAAKRLAPRAKFLRVTHRLELGIPVTYPKPTTIGADRLANACGAASRYGVPVIVADFGTAVTFDIVSAKEGYVGGVIAPGLPLMFSYLAEKTALLPHIRPARVRGRVGKSTEMAMQLGAHWGYRGLVREILAEIVKGLKARSVKLCATGGYAEWVLKDSGIPITIDPDLTLYGLGRIFELNHG